MSFTYVVENILRKKTVVLEKTQERARGGGTCPIRDGIRRAAKNQPDLLISPDAQCATFNATCFDIT